MINVWLYISSELLLNVEQEIEPDIYKMFYELLLPLSYF